jgi:opacity protein-like surface antigen
MKKFVLTLTIFCVACALASAGTERYSGKDKEIMQPAPPPCEWYRTTEWDVSIWGAFAFPSNDGSRNSRDLIRFHENNEGADNHEGDLGHLSNDRFLARDQNWGGGGSFKFFFCKYIGVGVEGYALAANNTVGGALGTLTLRYPIGCSRFAPYVFGGIGGAFGGTHTVLSEFPEEVFHTSDVDNDDSVLAGEVGAGLEYRFTRHIGVIADFSWNFLDGPNNDFGMVRSGLNFAF